jgi:peroxiredoxin
MYPLLLFALLQAPPAVGEPLRSGCSPDDPQIASLAPSDRIQVESALAGEEKTCYKISVARSPESLTGYVLGEGLPAVAAFARRREQASEQSTRTQLRPQRQPAAKTVAPAEPGKSQDPMVSKQFEEFSALDSNGHALHLSSLRGRAILVTFWSPRNLRTTGPLMAVGPVYNQFHDKGLDAIGVSMSPDPGAINSVLDDFPVKWPQVADRDGLAARYGVDPKAGKTFVLDASHRIVAAGPMGPDIIKAVRQLLDSPDK